MTTMLVSFPGGKRVSAEFDGFALTTDQPRASGGAGSAPSPFDLFLASIATCAGFYAKGYCDTRGLPTEGLALTMHVDREPATQKVGRLVIEIALPAGFPEKHREGVVRAAGLCAVKKHVQDPPAFEIHAVSRSLATAS